MENNCRLIDASAVLKHFDGYGFGQECDAEIILDYIAEGAPTVDAVEVVHGRWMVARESEISKNVWCSACDKGFYIRKRVGSVRIDEMPYCPNCGAKMDGDV